MHVPGCKTEKQRELSFPKEETKEWLNFILEEVLEKFCCNFAGHISLKTVLSTWNYIR